MMCIIRTAKKRGERRCFKVPEFDSTERLLVTSAPLCVGAHLFSARQNRERDAEEREKRRLIRGGGGRRGGGGGERKGRIVDLTKEKEERRLEEEWENESNGGGCLCECINNAIKWAHLRTSHITAICLAVNL